MGRERDTERVKKDRERGRKRRSNFGGLRDVGGYEFS